jgi:hypothetical protein
MKALLKAKRKQELRNDIKQVDYLIEMAHPDETELIYALITLKDLLRQAISIIGRERY